MATILLVDDDPTIREVVERYLRGDGHEVVTAADGEAAVEASRRVRPDLVVLDLMLPKLNGLEVCRLLQAERRVPVIMLTARGEEHDRVIGLGIGADDYVVKPFSPRELAARVTAVLRRASGAGPAAGQDVLDFGTLRVDPASREVTLRGTPLSLTAREFDLLHHVATNPNRVFTREQLLNAVWGYDFVADASTVTVHIHRLREKIEDDPSHPTRLVTVWGVGYRFTGE